MASSCGDSKSIHRGVLSAVDLKLKMDALVSDLSHALDESQLTQSHRKRRGFKRRSKMTSTIALPLCNRLPSEDSSSSIGEMTLSQDNKSSIQLTDSDEVTPPRFSRSGGPYLTHHRMPPNLVESDSVNENFSPARTHNKRKPKCKRMALDPEVASTSLERGHVCLHPFRRKKALRHLADPDKYVSSKVRFVEVSAGKRKRGRDRCIEFDNSGRRYNSNRQKQAGLHGLKISHNPAHGHAAHTFSHAHTRSTLQSSDLANEEYMDLEYSNESNISESSSESEAGIYTCDEGREADDEQSDWFAEPGAVYGVPWVESDMSGNEKRMMWLSEENIGLSPSAKALFKEKYERMSQESQQTCRLRFQKLRERLLRREIRAGRRRLQDRRPGFSIISSVNDKVSKFLQDSAQSELRLKPLTDRDRDQLRHLAKLYSLNVITGDDLAAPILVKTRKTITPTQLDTCLGGDSPFPGGVPVPLSDLKRRRRTPPLTASNLTEGSNDSVESVVANSGPGGSLRPPVPTVSWGDDDLGDCCADSLSERLADSEPDPVPSPTSLGLHDCTL